MNLSTTAILGTEDIGRRRAVRLKQESMYGLSVKKSGRCREVAISGGSTV